MPIKISNTWDRLARDAAEARNRGISYGKMKAIEYEKAQKERARQEAESRLMAEEARKRRKKQDEEAEKEAHDKETEEEMRSKGYRRVFCEFCGAEFYTRDKRKRFCTSSCTQRWNKADASRDPVKAVPDDPVYNDPLEFLR